MQYTSYAQYTKYEQSGDDIKCMGDGCRLQNNTILQNGLAHVCGREGDREDPVTNVLQTSTDKCNFCPSSEYYTDDLFHWVIIIEAIADFGLSPPVKEIHHIELRADREEAELSTSLLNV